ncbi:MAG: hypothetical protein AB7U20_10190 [Planctomycetaceae bacterium]
MKTHIPFLSCCLLWVAASVMGADEKPPRIKPEEARQHVGKKVEVVFEVKGAKHSLNRKTVYLDSEADFRDEKNLGIAISERGITARKEKRGVDAPAEYYKSKTIRVVGEVAIEDERPYIKVDDAAQLDLSDEKSPQ